MHSTRSDRPPTSPDRDANEGTLRIGPLAIGGRAVLAALSGYSDAAMRRVARGHGAPYCVHEVVLDRDVLAGGRLLRPVLDLAGADHPPGGQLMGSEPETFARAARALVDAGYDVIDLNFGCPVPKVLGRCRGGYLLGTPARALEVVERVLDAVAGDRPVTVKLRRGLDESVESERAFFAILDGAFARGVSAATVHPRTVRQRYVGASDWRFLRRVREHVGTHTLLGSGDLFAPHDILRMLRETRVDGVTVARGAIGNPWIFRQYAALAAGREPVAPTVAEQREVIACHVAALLRLHGDRRGFQRARTQAVHYAAVHPEPVAVRDAFVAAREPGDLERVLEVHYPASRAHERSSGLAALGLSAQRVRESYGADADEDDASSSCDPGASRTPRRQSRAPAAATNPQQLP